MPHLRRSSARHRRSILRAIRPGDAGVRRPLPIRMGPCVTTAITLTRYGHDDLLSIRQTLLDVHADAYADRMHEEFVQRFPWFVEHWGGREGFSCVIAYEGNEPVGFTYGAPGEPGRERWREHLDEPPKDPSTFPSLSWWFARIGATGAWGNAFTPACSMTGQRPWPFSPSIPSARVFRRCTRVEGTGRSASVSRFRIPLCMP